MTFSHFPQLTLIAIKAAVKAGQQVLEIYNSGYSTTYKEDKSPLTSADVKAHETISAMLSDTDIPLLSEEGRNIPWEKRRTWHYFWLVDPLDGTKEFISRNGEFTVNIALISGHNPVIGVIYVPVSGMLYFANQAIGSWSVDCAQSQVDSETITLEYLLSTGKKLPLEKSSNPVTILASRSHLTPETSGMIERIGELFPDCRIINAGSSLKFCRLAEGNAQYYPRFSPTMEWDTAAGHAIAAFAGISVNAWPGMDSLVYNNKESLVNPWFMAYNKEFPDFAG